MATTAATKEAAAIAVTNLGDNISIHTSDPGNTGASEATGGTPAYSRKATVWGAGAPDGVVTGSEVLIDAPAGNYSHFGIWADDGTTFLGGDVLRDTNGNVITITLSAQGQIRVTPTYTQT